jgi:DNA-binding CsgD family transcriptional regulator
MVYLTEQHPKISETELRQSCLIRLNLSNEQMANIMAISKDSVRKSNQRLREKLQFKEQGALIDYLFSIPQ